MNSASPLPQASEQAIQAARSAFEAADYDRAEAACTQILEARPEAVDVLTLLGEIEYKRGNPQGAAAWFDKAIARDRKHGRAHWLLGNISQDEGKLDRAITAYRRAIRADPQLSEAHNDLGTAYFGKGWYAEAEQCYRRALELRPDDVAATENLAAVLRSLGRIKESRDAYVRTLKLRLLRAARRFLPSLPRRAAPQQPGPVRDERLALAKELIAGSKWTDAQDILRKLAVTRPDDPEVFHLLGGTLGNTGDFQEAIQLLERAIAGRSSAPEYHVTLGNVLALSGRHADAIERYRMALMLDPGHGTAAASIARVLHDLGHFREAEEIYRLSLAKDPETAEAHNNLAATLISLGRFVDAEAAARAALARNPASVHALAVLALALIEQQRYDEARQVLEQARSLAPDDPLVLRWTAYLEMTLNAAFEAAEALLRRALRKAPEDASLHINLARSLLIRERYAEGWEEYEWRKKEISRAKVYRHLPYPEWNGEPLSGTAIVVIGEQGVGDEIMFASCIPELAAQARRCVLHMNSRLESLLRRSFPAVEVASATVAQGALSAGAYDFQVAAGSLPRWFRKTVDAFPRHDGYLKADAHKISNWRERLAGLGQGLKIGFSWRGGTPLSDQVRRTLKLTDFEALLALPGTHWISLQHGDCQAELAAFRAGRGASLHHWQEGIDDLDEIAALASALDLRITVCNTLVHVSGALGKETWVLAPLSPDWRYGQSGPVMRWYPSVRMFRQSKIAQWAPVLAELRSRLMDRMAGCA